MIKYKQMIISDKTAGHFGEKLDCYGVRIDEVTKGLNCRNADKFAEKMTILLIDIESAGEEPS